MEAKESRLMDAPTISIKIRGLQAVDALNNGQLLGGLKINGGSAMMAMRGMDGNRMMMAKKGLLMREMEMEGNRMMMAQPTPMGNMANAAPAAKTTLAAAPASVPASNVVAAKSATTAAVSGAATKGGAVGITKGIGLNLWLGGLGPWLVLGSVGMAAMGLYFYLRAQRLMLGNGDEELDER
jgi:hypothetical protein